MTTCQRLGRKRIIVIGAATGIGAATARRLAAEGANVCLADINIKGARGVAESIASTGGSALALAVDVADVNSVEELFGEAIAHLGGLDAVHVNVADMRMIYQDTDIVGVDLEVLDRTIAINLRGHALCTRSAIPHLLANLGGSIIYTSSLASQCGEPTRPSYAMAKSGVNALMRHVARRWGKDGIRANCIAPGFILTPEMEAGNDITDIDVGAYMAVAPHQRIGRASDVAAMVANLLSDDSSWVNGQVIHINGGVLMA